MSDYSAKEFARILMYGSSDEQSSEIFHTAGDHLRQAFTKTLSPVKNSQRVEFRNFVDYVRLTQGLDEALGCLEGFRTTGLPPELYATAGMIAARRANEYDRAAAHLESAHQIWPDNVTIHEFLIESLISISRFESASALFAAVKPTTEREVVRFGNLAAVMGRWDLVQRLVDPFKSEDSTFALQVLQERQRISTGFSGQQMEITAYVLNMPSDVRKLNLVSAHLNRLDVRMERQAGVDAGTMTAGEWAAWAGHDRLNLGAGAMGCALGHVAMWERFLASSDSFCLMMEDDAYPFVHGDIGALIDGAEEFDVLFVHNGMSALKSGNLRHGYTSVWEALEKRPEGGGWGAYGYILSKAGAEKLVDAVRADRITGHIDGQIASYGVHPTAEVKSNAQRIGRSIHSKSSSKTYLNIKCAQFPLIGTIDFGDSSIGRMGGHFG
ncbi:hypothetical protein OL239_07170 [Arthrobacter sp. ATA002]|uniref:glycosyltransferase family 25 protein n=1 Tax=Arthrobacter sp. ATA002 TaxID=2991715 RepID=UPI0022A6A492|nr:glycosyltransferase family 25 protein [Arthrobacter sp. ATA002]WAP52911.1 hypothetical protein OL239_07170 [Arthrobacter sp. ATA002]